ncbi:hypothetical protein EDD18DRAFT_495569 [Armillaria luteobubalina]|uniref:DUF6533 domain-containing protein n=1 Tax=Armillaria luteobubalina TaxID=153913 RepID=A0AA39QM19_9AGAR|nr:hypothetical protein EDD18DRAFT_495569 [Armillaria luteobubalina]
MCSFLCFGFDSKRNMSNTQSYWTSFTLQTYNCAYAIMVWDTLLTLSKEKRKIWDREWSPVKIIFLFNRYYGIASITVNLCFYNIQVPTEECAKYVKAEPLIANFTIISYQSILLLRCYAVWLCDKRILYCGVGMLICQFVEAMYACSRFYPLPVTGEVGPCVVQGEKFWIASVFLFPTITDTVLTIVTFARVFHITPKTRSSVISRFLREGFLFFLIVFVGNCANGILYLQPNRDISTIFSGFAIIFGNVCGNHLILAARHDGSAGPGSSESPRRTSSGRGCALSGRGVLVHTTVDVELDEFSPGENSGDLPVKGNREL